MPADIASRSFRRPRWLVWGSALLLAWLLVPAVASAQTPSPTPPESVLPCTQCHSEETHAWQDSPHAASGVTCEACHGPFKEGHPATEEMLLGVDSTACSTCHGETYAQWEDSLHAKAGVQCIGCHLSHSQDFRLTDEALCSSCHRDTAQNFDHSAHAAAGVTCTTCHVSSLAGHVEEGITVPSHQFGVVSEVCISCHGEGIHEQAMVSAPTPQPSVATPATSATATEVAALTARLQSLERSNRTFQTFSVVALGLGLGVGGMLGIVFVLIVGQIVQRGGK